MICVYTCICTHTHTHTHTHDEIVKKKFQVTVHKMKIIASNDISIIQSY